MKIFKNKQEVRRELLNINDLYFVPTMGSLHNGHISLIKKAKKNNNKVLVSIFVNPKQFNSKKDFISYPINIERDVQILKKLKINYLYIPTYKDLFSFNAKNKVYLHKFSKKLCGKYRKNHFKGVVNVVNRFIEILKPKYILLGKKDFQQSFLIKKHLEKNFIPTKVIECKTIRDNKGVPLSSRNINLSKNNLKIVSKIYSYLKFVKSKVNKQKKLNKNIIINNILSFGVDKVQYIDLVNINFNKKTPKYNIFIAYYINNVRLIDNF